MKKSKLILLWGLTFIAGLVVGGGVSALWTRANTSCLAYQPGRSIQTQLLLAQLEEAGLPDGVREEKDTAHELKTSAEIPSQLVRTDLPDDIVLGGEAPAQPAETASGVVLSDGQNTVVLNSKKPAQRAADGTSITLIEAPVQPKRIKTLEEYKAFKQIARGSYPTVDFSKEEVIVLESASNLPDKVFEIVDITPEGDTLKVRYRVNVFGLGNKINTHSAQKMAKTDNPVFLEQVL